MANFISEIDSNKFNRTIEALTFPYSTRGFDYYRFFSIEAIHMGQVAFKDNWGIAVYSYNEDRILKIISEKSLPSTMLGGREQIILGYIRKYFKLSPLIKKDGLTHEFIINYNTGDIVFDLTNKTLNGLWFQRPPFGLKENDMILAARSNDLLEFNPVFIEKKGGTLEVAYFTDRCKYLLPPATFSGEAGVDEDVLIDLFYIFCKQIGSVADTYSYIKLKDYLPTQFYKTTSAILSGGNKKSVERLATLWHKFLVSNSKEEENTKLPNKLIVSGNVKRYLSNIIGNGRVPQVDADSVWPLEIDKDLTEFGVFNKSGNSFVIPGKKLLFLVQSTKDLVKRNGELLRKLQEKIGGNISIVVNKTEDYQVVWEYLRDYKYDGLGE